MSAVIEQEKVYKPINGEDAIDLILDRFRDELVNSGMFPLHRTWHEFEFVGGVRVKGWSTKTEEVKFVVTRDCPQKGAIIDSTQTGPPEHVEGRVDVKLAPAPPSLLRESLPNIECPNKCGHVPFHSKESLKGHLNRWCKGDKPSAVSIHTDTENLSGTNEGQSPSDQGSDASENV